MCLTEFFQRSISSHLVPVALCFPRKKLNIFNFHCLYFPRHSLKETCVVLVTLSQIETLRLNLISLS